MNLLQTNKGQLAVNVLLGCIGVFLYGIDTVPPISISTTAFLVTSIIFFKDGFHGRVYSFFLVLLCLLPLLHIIGYVVIDNYSIYPNFIPAVADQYNPELTKRLALMALVTISGILVGVNFGLGDSGTVASTHNAYKDIQVSPSFSKIMVLALMSLVLMHVDAPEATIFREAYTESISISVTAQLGSLFPIAFGFNLMAWYLYFNLGHSKERAAALILLSITTFIIIVFYQLMRGDREFFGLAIGLFFLADRYTSVHKKLIEIIFCGAGIFFIMQFIGMYRSIAVESIGLIDGIIDFFVEEPWFNGTWTAVLLTPLATLGDYYSAQRQHLLGQTYIDYMLSLPPTPVANWLGYERPITAERGPAWDVSYGLGGTYISVVPFVNFSMIGVFVQTALLGFFVGTVDRMCYRNASIWVLLSFAIGVVLWGAVWYGEMYILRSLVTTFPLLLLTWHVLGLQNTQLSGSLGKD